MPGVRRLWLVRHGETEGQSSIRYHGRNDVALNDVGRAQIHALAPWVRQVPFRRVVCSPLRRAAESAAILAAHCGLPATAVEVEERLREISFGACEGMTRDEIAAAFPAFWPAYEQGLVDTFPDGEPRAAFAARVAAAIRELASMDWGSDLLVVAHRGTVRQALRTLLELRPGEPDAFAVELGSVSVLRHEGSFELEVLGRVP
jgi:broad specificity phosphatase PhoE